MKLIAERTGGQLLSELETYAPMTPSEMTALWPYFAFLGLLAFLLELTLRRFITPRAERNA
jgi:hypothetical protein